MPDDKQPEREPQHPQEPGAVPLNVHTQEGTPQPEGEREDFPLIVTSPSEGHLTRLKRIRRNQAKFLLAFRQTVDFGKALEAGGVSESTIRRWLREFSDFGKEYDRVIFSLGREGRAKLIAMSRDPRTPVQIRAKLGIYIDRFTHGLQEGGVEVNIGPNFHASLVDEIEAEGETFGEYEGSGFQRTAPAPQEPPPIPDGTAEPTEVIDLEPAPEEPKEELGPLGRLARRLFKQPEPEPPVYVPYEPGGRLRTDPAPDPDRDPYAELERGKARKLSTWKPPPRV